MRLLSFYFFLFFVFFFQAEDGIRDISVWLEFRRVLFRSSKWVGEAEQNIRKLFEAAKGEDQSIIFMDEVEALIPKRKSDGSTVMQRVVPQILQDRKSVV